MWDEVKVVVESTDHNQYFLEHLESPSHHNSQNRAVVIMVMSKQSNRERKKEKKNNNFCLFQTVRRIPAFSNVWVTIYPRLSRVRAESYSILHIAGLRFVFFWKERIMQGDKLHVFNAIQQVASD